MDERLNKIKAQLIMLGFHQAFFDAKFMMHSSGFAVSLFSGMFTDDYKVYIMPTMASPRTHKRMLLGEHTNAQILEEIIHSLDES